MSSSGVSSATSMFQAAWPNRSKERLPHRGIRRFCPRRSHGSSATDSGTVVAKLVVGAHAPAMPNGASVPASSGPNSQPTYGRSDARGVRASPIVAGVLVRTDQSDPPIPFSSPSAPSGIVMSSWKSSPGCPCGSAPHMKLKRYSGKRGITVRHPPSAPEIAGISSPRAAA